MKSALKIFLLLMTLAVITHARRATTKILFLGDSLTEGYGIAPEDAFPAIVEKNLRKSGFEVEVINAGSSGSTTASGPSRLRWHLKSKPDILVLALGANDGLRGIPHAEIRKNLISTLDLARGAQLKVLLVGMKMPPNYGSAYTRGFESIFTDLALQYRVPLVPFLLDRIAGEADLNLADGIHPNEKGHHIMATSMTQSLEIMLKATP